jgi:uncharacterized membrane protein
VKALEESGLSAQDAFTEAFLQQAEEQIEKVGHAADSAAGSFDRLEASFRNQSDSMKKQLATVVEPTVTAWVDMRERMVTYQDKLEEALERGAITEEQYGRIVRKVGNFQMTRAEATELLEGYLWTLNIEEEKYAKTIDQTAENMIEASIQTALYGDAVEELGQVTIDASLAMQKYTEALLFKLASEGLDAEAALSLAEAMGLVDENTMYAASQMNTLRERFDAGLISAEQYEAAVVALGEEIENLDAKSATIDIELKLNDPHRLRNWKLEDQHATYTVNTVRTGDSDVRQRPTGGPVYEGNPYLWQEYGYRGELLVPSQNGFVLSRSDAERIFSSAVSKGAGQQVVNNFNLTMPTTANPADMVTAFEIMEAYGA